MSGRIQRTGAKQGRATGQGAAAGRNLRFNGGAPAYEAFTKEHQKLVYDTSRWEAFLHDSRSAATKEAEEALRTPIGTDEDLSGQVKKIAGMAESIGRELYGRLYGNPERLPADLVAKAPGWMPLVHDTLDEMPEWEQLRRQVGGDADFSALATSAMLNALGPQLPDLIAQVKRDAEPDPEPELDENGQPKPRAPRPKPIVSAQDALRAGLRSACVAAAADAADGKDNLGGIAPGLDDTPPAEQQQQTERFDLIQAVQKDPDFAEIARRAGRLRRISGRSELRRSKETHEEVVDIELGGDIGRLLPSELTGLLDPDLEIVTLARIVERRALQQRLEGHEPLGRGPIVFLRDVSGSMSGDGHLWGAAVAVALSAQSAREKRAMISCAFNHGVHAERKLSPGSFEKLSGAGVPTGTLVSGRYAQAAAATAHASQGCDGGTDFGAPLAFAMAAGVLEPRADFVLISDGQADCDADNLAKLVIAKGTGLRVFGLTVNGGSISPALREICDEVLDVDSSLMADERAAGEQLGRWMGALR